jgi:hypothetical protein
MRSERSGRAELQLVWKVTRTLFWYSMITT